MKAYGEVNGLWSHSRPDHFTHGERAPGTHWMRGWVGARTGLDEAEKITFLTLPELELDPSVVHIKVKLSLCLTN
jgi:hypothetical protein